MPCLRKRTAQERIASGAVLGDADELAFEFHETVQLGIRPDEDALGRRVGQSRKNRHIGALGPRSERRRRAGGDIIEIAGNQRLNRPRRAGDQEHVRRKTVLGENSGVLGQMEHALARIDRHMSEHQLLCADRSRQGE